MTQFVAVGTTWKSVAAKFVGVGGVWKAIQQEWVGVSGAWKQSLASLFVSISPASQSSTGSVATHTFSAETVTPSGGSGSYAYLWSLNVIEGNWTLASGQGTASAVYRVAGLVPGDTGDAYATCAVSDTVTGVVTSVTAELTYGRT